MTQKEMEKQIVQTTGNEDKPAFILEPKRLELTYSNEEVRQVNENPIVILSPLWFKNGWTSGTCGNVKYTLFDNLNKTNKHHPDCNLSISSSFVKTLEDGTKEYGKCVNVSGMWTQDKEIVGSHKDSTSEYVVFRNPKKQSASSLPDFFLGVRTKIKYDL